MGILTEADRIATKNLLTLREEVSEKLFREMTWGSVPLRVPEPLKTTFPPAAQKNPQAVESFIADVRQLKCGKCG